MAQNPQNPRPYYLETQGLLYMPATYGGVCGTALPVMNRATKLFNAFEIKSSIVSNWGKNENDLLMQGYLK